LKRGPLFLASYSIIENIRLGSTESPQRGLCGSRLVAEAGADGNLVTAFGAAAAEDGGTGFGLHASQETVGLGAVAAVRLKGTLRHDKNSCAGKNTCSNFWAVATIYENT
jgi:hypothetical protein